VLTECSKQVEQMQRARVKKERDEYVSNNGTLHAFFIINNRIDKSYRKKDNRKK
jgi:hypothetical protein